MTRGEVVEEKKQDSMETQWARPIIANQSEDAVYDFLIMLLS